MSEKDKLRKVRRTAVFVIMRRRFFAERRIRGNEEEDRDENTGNLYEYLFSYAAGHEG